MRLACVKRAANVRSEPGSNSPVKSGEFSEPSVETTEIRGSNFVRNVRIDFRLSERGVSLRTALSSCDSSMAAYLAHSGTPLQY